ncbi:MAG: glycosyltransferase family 4 protein [Bacteroidia bacterium]|jgi:colanic acid/amylovoran biosynthesis glycosyltransferase|nr:glycosyltransferase family 4 protein [Bacteroidia bacterium]
MALNHSKVLVIIGEWPGATHPYLTRLFAELKKEFPFLQLLMFEKSNREYAFPIIGKEQTAKVLFKALYRFTNMYNPLSHLHTLLLCLLHSKHTFKIINNCVREGLTVKQTYGQLFYYRALLGKQYDLVHINALQTAFHFKTKAWFGNAKVLVSSRGQDFDLYPTKYDQVLGYADHIHVLGQYLKDKVTKRNKALHKQTTIIPPSFQLPVSVDSTPKIGISSKVKIASAARLEWVKGFNIAIETMLLLKEFDIDFQYDIYGTGNTEIELNYLIKLHGLEQNVRMLGWIDEPALIEALKNYDLYLLLSISESFNNSVLLAQSLGLPCIVSDAGGLPENVVNEQTGIVVPRYNAEAAANAIKTIISKPNQYSTFSRQAIERAQLFTQKAQTQKYVQLYQQLLLS